jgi:alpha-D-xyloside xylohydrolase
MNRLLVIYFCLFIIPNAFASDINFNYTKTEDGVTLLPKAGFVTNTAFIKIQVVTDKIIRVIAAPQKASSTASSLITSYKSVDLPVFNLLPSDGEKLTLKTQFLNVSIDLNTGAVSFFDATGNPVLNERKVERRLSPVVHEGNRSYEISQTFETSTDDAWYGLGQHQDGLFNYKGYQVNLFQNNTEVAVPFLISRKNYGILWDNYSITKVGDVRDYKPLKEIKLFSMDDQPGWLSSSYCNDKTKPNDAVLERPESEIKMEFLGDSKLLLPAEFSPAKGLVKWEGAIGSEMEGGHKMRFTYGGYIKVWFDNKLVLDRWRQNWNPGSAILNFDMVKGKKYPFKIEWVPDGGESYISLKWMEPTEEKNENSFSFKSEAGQQEDYYFVYGNDMDDVISGYRLLTGKAVMLPKWALGFWQSRERYKTQEEILNTVSEFRKRKIPLDNIVLDWNYWKEDQWGSQQFDATRFPNPDSMIQVIHDKYHTQLMISVWPKFYEGIASYKMFDKNGWLYKRNIADRQRDWIAKGYVSTFYDPFNAAARKGFWNLLNENLYKKGVDAWWMDASEPDILSSVSAEKRKEQMYPLAAGITAEFLNAYPLENAKGIYEGQRETNPDKRVFILTRSGFAGMQRYAAATWSGDISSRWHDMLNQISAGINFSMSGMPYWTMDAGGFAVEDKYLHPTSEESEEWRELMPRWYQFGAFVPLFRVHGQPPFREIYNVAPETHPAYKSMLYYNKFRYRLMPYIYSVAGKTYFENYTIMRGLVMDFAGDEAVKNIADQYMFGPSLLVSPVSDYKQRSRKVYLPMGQGWYNLYSGKYLDGGQSINADAPFERMPVFVKAGAIIPFGPELQYTAEKKADTITLYVYAGKDGAFTLYEDEGLNYNYEKGLFANIKFFYSESNQSITINEREGAFPGMLKKRYFRIKYNRKETESALSLDNREGQIITYNGKKQIVHLK